MSASRRRFIFTGIAGAAALGIVRLLQPVPSASTADAGVLSGERADVMRALLPALLDGALPADASARAIEIERTLRDVAVAIEGLPPIAQQELSALFALLTLVPVRVAVAGVDEPWRHASVDDASRFLDHLRRSRWAQKRAAYDALHQLAFASFYANPGTWPAIGYPGPPSVE